MMIDEVTLAGPAAYLRRVDGTTLLSSGEVGVSEPVVRGESVDVDALDLYIETDDPLLDLFPRASTPLVSIELRKEVFPHYFLDPHAHRVHQVAGFEDFRSAEESSMYILEIDGIPTLLSPGDGTKSRWRSARYRLARPIVLDGLAWTLAGNRGSPPDAWSYQVWLHHWPPGDNDMLASSRSTIELTAGAHDPSQARHLELPSPVEVGGYQLEFEADVQFDAALDERHGDLPQQSVGTPLLQAIFLVERLEPVYALHSVHELIGLSSSHELLDPTPPIRRMTARLNFPAILNEGEQVLVTVHSGAVRRCEARLDAAIRMRPAETLAEAT
jgi:hypothetical protein